MRLEQTLPLRPQISRLFSYNKLVFYEASRGAGIQSLPVKMTGCVFDSHPRKFNIYLNYVRINYEFKAILVFVSFY